MSNTPETPFDGVIVDREIVVCAQEDAKPCTICYLGIIHADDMDAEAPRVLIHAFRVWGNKYQPKMMLREGHKVRIGKVGEVESHLAAYEIDFDSKQIADRFLAERKKSERS